MPDVLDLLQCPACGTFYKPKTTATGRTVLHCVLAVKPSTAPVRMMDGEVHLEWLRGEVRVDWDAIERRVVRSLLTGGVVDPPLTGSTLDIEV